MCVTILLLYDAVARPLANKRFLNWIYLYALKSPRCYFNFTIFFFWIVHNTSYHRNNWTNYMYKVPLKHSKTCQFREACPHLPLPALPGNSTLCPVTAVVRLLSLCPSLPPTAPLFCYPTPDGLVLLTQPMMELSLRTHIAGAGLQSANYGTHSLRRGGASWAFQSGMPAELIKVLVGWESNCYQIYLDMTLDTKFQMMKHFVKYLPS